MSVALDLKKILSRIRRYERNLRKRDYRDGSGSRFLLGSLYLLLGDAEGALTHYKWFERKFPDDGGEPFYRLGWALAMLRAQKPDKAVERLRRAHAENVYMIPAILGIPHGQPKVRRGSNWQDEEYILGAPPEFLAMWHPEEKKWLRSVWESLEFREFVQTHINLVSQLDHEPVGSKRSALVDALYALPSGGKNKSAAKPWKGETIH